MKTILSPQHIQPSSSLSLLKTFGAAALATIFSITAQAQDKEIYSVPGEKIDYSGCGSITSTGRVNCGKIIPTKYYYRLDSNIPLTLDEVNQYVHGGMAGTKENTRNGAKYVEVETNLGEKDIIPAKEMIILPGEKIGDDKGEVSNTTAQQK